jgi:CcmD family protein
MWFESVDSGRAGPSGDIEVWKGLAMGTFITAYVIVWLAFVLYIIRLGSNQRRLNHLMQTFGYRIRELRAQGETRSEPELGA